MRKRKRITNSGTALAMMARMMMSERDRTFSVWSKAEQVIKSGKVNNNSGKPEKKPRMIASERVLTFSARLTRFLATLRGMKSAVVDLPWRK